MKPYLCYCGRPVRIKVNGKYKKASDDGHDLCQQCWKSLKDRQRNWKSDCQGEYETSSVEYNLAV